MAPPKRGQFFAIVARLMRRILVDHTRGRQSNNEAGGLPVSESPEGVIEFDEALKRLSALDLRKGQIVELRIFGGLTIDETADLLDVSIGTVINDYRAAKAWLRRELER